MNQEEEIFWERGITTGDRFFDEKHDMSTVVLMDCYNRLKNGCPIGIQLDSLEFIAQHYRLQFFDEEQRMQEVDLPDLDEHKNAHKKLITLIDDHVYLLKRNRGEYSLYEFFTFVVHWTKNHIRNFDQPAAEYIAA